MKLCLLSYRVMVKIWLWIENDLFLEFYGRILWKINIVSHSLWHYFVLKLELVLIDDVGLWNHWCWSLERWCGMDMQSWHFNTQISCRVQIEWIKSRNLKIYLECNYTHWTILIRLYAWLHLCIGHLGEPKKVFR